MAYFPQIGANGMTVQLPYGQTFSHLTSVSELKSGPRQSYAWRTNPLMAWDKTPFVRLAAHVLEFPRWTPSNVKLLLPPRQSWGASPVWLGVRNLRFQMRIQVRIRPSPPV